MDMSGNLDPKALRKVGDVQLGESIGRGAFGRVYRGLNTKDGTVVAVKEIDKGMLTPDKLPSIKRESELLEKLNHPHIVKFISCSETEEYLYFILEYIESGSLYSVGKKFGFFSEELLKIYVFQLLAGLEYLHSQGVVHRDIKGANLLLTKEGIVKLADFGSCTYEAINKQYTVVGTPFWMAPEIIEMSGGGKVSDIWSVGCTVIELLTGKPPYWDMGATCALYKMVQNEQPPLPADISSTLVSFLRACFTRDPSKRPSAAELQGHEWLAGVVAKKASAPAPNEMSKSLRREKEKSQDREITKLKSKVARLRDERNLLAAKLTSVEHERDELKAELSLQRMGHLPTAAMALSSPALLLSGSGDGTSSDSSERPSSGRRHRPSSKTKSRDKSDSGRRHRTKDKSSKMKDKDKDRGKKHGIKPSDNDKSLKGDTEAPSPYNLGEERGKQDDPESLPLEEDMICGKCNKEITSETNGRAAMDSYFHPNCFTCEFCQKVLDKYVVNDGKPYCLEDFDTLFAHRCGGCGEIIRGAFINALGKYWHAEHFTCLRCSSIVTSTFVPREGRPLCKDCLELERH